MNSNDNTDVHIECPKTRANMLNFDALVCIWIIMYSNIVFSHPNIHKESKEKQSLSEHYSYEKNPSVSLF